MSALDIYDGHRLEIFSDGAFSETFIYGVDSEFKGVFDWAWQSSDNDAGNAQQKKRTPRIMVDSIPADLAIDTEITRVRTGDKFHVMENHEDPSNISVIWLY